MKKTIPMLIILFFGTILFAAEEDDGQIDGLQQLPTPDVSASFAVGVNYDFLRNPLNHSFEGSRGYWGVNIPVPLKMSDEMMADLTSPVSKYFTDGELFVPEIVVKQYANSAIQVEVPMLGGVCSFSNIDMLNINYSNNFSMPTALFNPPDSLIGAGDDADISMMLRSAMEVPLDFALGWETTTFGYLYRFDNLAEDLYVALNLTRHHTYFDVSGNVNINIAGDITIEQDIGGLTLTPDYHLDNSIEGFYSLDRWSPSFAAKFWRFFAIARIGFRDKAQGSLKADYSVPFFVDKETFQFSDSLQDTANIVGYIFDHKEDFQKSRTVDVLYSTENNMTWQMPTGLTFGYEIIPEKLRLSYTKIINRIRLELVDNDYSTDEEFQYDSLDFRVSAAVDHMINLKADFEHINFTMGVFSFDVSYNDNDRIISTIIDEGDSPLIKYGEGALVPVLNGGAVIGNELQLMGELDILPIPSFKTGVIYNF
ncbi:MAG: hypothetical protein ACQEQV_04410 [Fibrobacterota bacterium]